MASNGVGRSKGKDSVQIDVEIKPPSILLRHNICYSTNASVVEDDLVDKITVLHALKFGNRAGELGSIQRDEIVSETSGMDQCYDSMIVVRL